MARMASVLGLHLLTQEAILEKKAKEIWTPNLHNTDGKGPGQDAATAQCVPARVSSPAEARGPWCGGVCCAAETPLVLGLDSGRALVCLILRATGGFPFLQESQLVEDT